MYEAFLCPYCPTKDKEKVRSGQYCVIMVFVFSWPVLGQLTSLNTGNIYSKELYSHLCLMSQTSTWTMWMFYFIFWCFIDMWNGIISLRQRDICFFKKYTGVHFPLISFLGPSLFRMKCLAIVIAVFNISGDNFIMMLTVNILSTQIDSENRKIWALQKVCENNLCPR